MQCQNASASITCRKAATEGNQPTLRIVAIGVDMKRPAAPGVAQQFTAKIEAIRDFDVGRANRGPRLDIEDSALKSGILEDLPGVCQVNGYATVRRRKWTDEE
jgi:hypothetical protein